MQSNENIDTFFPKKDCWVVFESDTGDYRCSEGMEVLAVSLDMEISALVPLLERTQPGIWPVSFGGRLFRASSFSTDGSFRIVSLTPSDPQDTASLIEFLTGEELFAVTSPDGRVTAVSRQAEAIFRTCDTLNSMFDSSSSGAIQAALRKCMEDDSVPEFIASHSDQANLHSSYGITMRRLPVPGRMILCKFSIPSVAVVTGAPDRNSLIRVLLEESYCPIITVDLQGTISTMNSAARELCRRLWGYDPTGSPFHDLVHHEEKSTLILRHQQRVEGFAVPSRYTVKLSVKNSSEISTADISVVPLHGPEQWVVFVKPLFDPNCLNGVSRLFPAPEHLFELLERENSAPEEMLQMLLTFLGAVAAAYVSPESITTVGDSRILMQSIDRNLLAAKNPGPGAGGTYHHRINSGFGLSHLLIHGIPQDGVTADGIRMIRITARIIQEHQIRTTLTDQKKMLSLLREIASAFLKGSDSLHGLLADFSKGCGVETAVVYRIDKKGSFLQAAAGAGTVGAPPDLPLEALNTASWACIRGETAFYTDAPENDLRFSRVFPESLSELAVPFFTATTPDGVILLASSEKELFRASVVELAQLLGLLFTVPENLPVNAGESRQQESPSHLKDSVIEEVIHNITALESAVVARTSFLKADAGDRSDLLEGMSSLGDSVSRLVFHSRWALWFLRTSLYGGKPDQKWIDPSPLLGKTLEEFQRFSGAEGIEIVFNPPPSDIEVCTDGSFVSMIAHSLLMCILDNCPQCETVSLTIRLKEDHWTFTLQSDGDSIPGECLSTERHLDGRNMSFVLAWKLTDELGGTVSTFTNRGRSTRMVIRLRVSG